MSAKGTQCSVQHTAVSCRAVRCSGDSVHGSVHCADAAKRRVRRQQCLQRRRGCALGHSEQCAVCSGYTAPLLNAPHCATPSYNASQQSTYSCVQRCSCVTAESCEGALAVGKGKPVQRQWVEGVLGPTGGSRGGLKGGVRKGKFSGPEGHNATPAGDFRPYRRGQVPGGRASQTSSYALGNKN